MSTSSSQSCSFAFETSEHQVSQISGRSSCLQQKPSSICRQNITIASCTAPRYWKAIRCVTGGHIPRRFKQFGLLLGWKLENFIDLFMLRLPGLQDMIDNPQPIMRKKPCNQELLDHVKTVSFKKKRQIRERHAFLASYDIFFS